MDGKIAIRDRALAKIANRQHGVVSIGQLRSVGISEDAVRTRVRAGRLYRIHRGVYGVGHTARSDKSRWMAAVLACGKRDSVARAGASIGPGADGTGDGASTMSVIAYWGAALSHRSAAELWGLLPPRAGPVDVSVCGDGGRSGRTGVRIHRSQLLLPTAVTSRNGIPVTNAAKTIADLGRVSTGIAPLISPRELRRAIRQANFLGLPVDEADRRERTRSDLELDFLAFCRRFDLPLPEVNVRVGPHLVDFYWRERRLVVETDGWAAHRGRAAFEDDRGRDLDLLARGHQAIHIAEVQLDEEPEQVAEVLRAALADRGAGLRVGADGD
jgi:very-short-patch-repair endonuclease